LAIGICPPVTVRFVYKVLCASSELRAKGNVLPIAMLSTMQIIVGLLCVGLNFIFIFRGWPECHPAGRLS